MGALLGLGGLHLVLGGRGLPSGLLQGLGGLGQAAGTPASWVFSRSSSLARLRMPALREAEPPVMEPPGLSTWPSRVTMRKR